MNKQTHVLLKSLSLALLSVAFVAVITKLLSRVLPITPNILFAGAITLATIYGGLKIGIVSLLTTVLTINYFFIAPLHALTLATDDLFRFVALSISVPVALWMRQQNLVWRPRRGTRRDSAPPDQFKP